MKYSVAGMIAIGLICFVLPASEAHQPVVITSGHGANTPKQPQAATGAGGKVHIIFGIGDAVQIATSSDSGVTFDKPKPAFRVPNLSLGMRRGPRIVSTTDALVVTAIGGQTGKGRDGDVLAWRSADDGTTWHGPVRVNDAADSAREGLHAMASGEDGSVWCVWLDLRDRKTEIYAARSLDDGATWKPNICVYRSPDGSVCECCHPSVIVAKNGVHIMFRNSLAGKRDMYITSSTDGGESFSPAMKLGEGTWQLDACPMDGGMLAALRNGKIETVWRRDNSIVSALNSGKSEILLGRGQQPWITATEKGSFIVWTTGRDGDLMLRTPGAKAPSILAHNSRDPMLVTSPSGTGPVFCCWESKKGDNVDVVVQRIDASGVSPE